MIRTLVVDDHPAVVGGLVSALRAEPGLVPVGVAGGAADGLAAAERSRPDVALVDHHLADGDGLLLCFELRRRPTPPAVLIYSAFTDAGLALAAGVAGASGVLDKATGLEDLFEAVRMVARGDRILPHLDPGSLEHVVARLDPEHLPILGMRVDDATVPEIAAVLHASEAIVERRIAEIVGRLTQPAGAPPDGV